MIRRILAALLCFIVACVVAPADAQLVNGWNLGAAPSGGGGLVITSMSQLPSYLDDWDAVNATNSSGVTAVADTGPNNAPLSASGVNKPVYVASAVNGYPGIQCVAGNPSMMSTSINIPWATKKATAYMVEYPVSTGTLVLWESPASAYANQGIGAYPNFIVLNNSGSNFAIPNASSAYQVYVWQFDGTGNIYGSAEYIGRNRIGWSPPTTVSSNFTSGTMNLCNRTGFATSETITRFVVYNDAHTPAQIAAGINYLDARYRLNTTTPTVEVRMQGDSISSTYGSVTENYVARAIYSGNYTHTQFTGVQYPGKTRATAVTNRVAENATYSWTGTRDYINWLATNDLAGCTDASGVPALTANIVTMITYEKAQGARNIAEITMLPRTGTSELCREGTAGINVWLRANASTYGFTVIDAGGAASTIGAAGADTNTTYYQGDAVHLNDTGQAYLYTNYMVPYFTSVGYN